MANSQKISRVNQFLGQHRLAPAVRLYLYLRYKRGAEPNAHDLEAKDKSELLKSWKNLRNSYTKVVLAFLITPLVIASYACLSHGNALTFMALTVGAWAWLVLWKGLTGWIVVSECPKDVSDLLPLTADLIVMELNDRKYLNSFIWFFDIDLAIATTCPELVIALRGDRLEKLANVDDTEPAPRREM